MNKGMFTSNRDDWETPRDLFDNLNKQYNFDVDVCATPANTKCAVYFTKDQDGLAQEWNHNKTYWMNPPYGRSIGKWIRKAYESAQGGATVVCLVPARTDTAWWHDYCMKGEITFIRGRIYFELNGARSVGAPFPSAIVVFNPM